MLTTPRLTGRNQIPDPSQLRRVGTLKLIALAFERADRPAVRAWQLYHEERARVLGLIGGARLKVEAPEENVPTLEEAQRAFARIEAQEERRERRVRARRLRHRKQQLRELLHDDYAKFHYGEHHRDAVRAISTEIRSLELTAPGHIPALARRVGIRARGAGRPRGSRSSARSGDSPSGEPEPAADPIGGRA